jgi:osmotically-inducible protein OsmY
VRQSASRSNFVGILLGAVCAPLCGFWTCTIAAAQATASGREALQEITVTARKVYKSDEQVTAEVEAALHSDRYIFSDHVTITSKNGVVTLRGIALDYWDVSAMKRLVRKMPGVKKVVDDLDVRVGGE